MIQRLLNQPVPFLQGQHFAVSVFVHLVDAFRRRFRRHHGGNVSDPVLDGPLDRKSTRLNSSHRL